jgi:hypothetical protein
MLQNHRSLCCNPLQLLPHRHRASHHSSCMFPSFHQPLLHLPRWRFQLRMAHAMLPANLRNLRPPQRRLPLLPPRLPLLLPPLSFLRVPSLPLLLPLP